MKRTRADRLDTRIRRLEHLAAHDERARNAMTALVAEARPTFDGVQVRRDLVRRRDRLPGPMSDRRLPPVADRPPMARMLTPRGSALRVYLLGLLAGQVRTRPGARPVNSWPIRRHHPGEPGWLNLYAVNTDDDPARTGAVSDDDRLQRQFKHALNELAAPKLHLVALPAASRSMDRFEKFRLLHESGDSSGTDLEYTVPLKSDPTFTLPKEFFTHGWIHVLEKAEIAAMAMMLDLNAKPLPGPAAGHGLNIGGDDRIAWFGLSKDTYDLLPTLAAYGLLNADVSLARRVDGTVEDFDTRTPPRRTYYSLVPDAFQRPAFEIVSEHVRRQRQLLP